jgi:histidinol dehydrogenase
MTVIPARVAGVGEIIVTVPTPDGVRNPLVLAAMHIAGVSRVFCVGGAQAIAALAFGTNAIPRVDKIVGPGGAYVAANVWCSARSAST